LLIRCSIQARVIRLAAIVGIMALPGCGGGGSQSGPSAPSELAIVADSSTGLSVYTIDPTSGSLTPVAGSPFAAGALTAISGSPFLPAGQSFNQPASIAIEPSGNFLYATSSRTGVFAFSISSATGALTALTGSPLFASNGGDSIVTFKVP
jgi:6-phosphogluconolactonase (cycloisomerase 2 family)